MIKAIATIAHPTRKSRPGNASSMRASPATAGHFALMAMRSSGDEIAVAVVPAIRAGPPSVLSQKREQAQPSCFRRVRRCKVLDRNQPLNPPLCANQGVSGSLRPQGYPIISQPSFVSKAQSSSTKIMKIETPSSIFAEPFQEGFSNGIRGSHRAYTDSSPAHDFVRAAHSQVALS